jgi:hypothetical protein
LSAEDASAGPDFDAVAIGTFSNLVSIGGSPFISDR